MLEGLTFDDVLIIPSYSDIESRNNISTVQEFLGFKLRVPVIAANMNTVTGIDSARAMTDAGGFGILSRFNSSNKEVYEDQFLQADTLRRSGFHPHVSVGAKTLYSGAVTKTIDDLLTLAATVTIDTAHGYSSQVLDSITFIRNTWPNLKIIAGNVVQLKAAFDLAYSGAHAIKVGIGPGAACTTRLVTGVGYPQFSAIQDVSKIKKQFNIKVIADGGINTTGDIVKALAAGADAVMIGRMLASAIEAPGDTINDYGKIYKRYTGQSSFGRNKELGAPEGTSDWIRQEGTVSDKMVSYSAAIRSGMSYVGARTLDELHDKAQFVRVTQASLKESGIRI